MTDLGNGLYAVDIPEFEKYDSKDYGNIMWYRDKENNICKWAQGSLLHMEYLGTVTASEISFDVHPYCEKDTVNTRKYKLYPKGVTNFNTVSFRSLLASKGLYFDNEGKEPECGFTEQNLVQKLVILKRTPKQY